MPERNASADSFQDFFGTSKNDNDIPNNSAIAALIKTQPVVHQRRNSLDTRATTNSQKTPLTTSVKNSPVKSKHIESPPAPTVTSNYESDFDDDVDVADKKKHTSLSPPERPRRMSDPKQRGSYVIKNPQQHQRKEKLLPRIRPKNKTKRLKQEAISDVRKRVLSAQNQKFNELQSRLNELRRQLENERFENQTLRMIQKREEKALRKYEDQEYDIHKVARNYTHEIADVKDKIIDEKESQTKLEKNIEDRNEQLHDQNKRIRFYHKLVEEEPELDQSDELRQRLEEAEKKLKKYEKKIAHNEKEIENREKIYRHEIRQELIKQRELKHELQDHAKKFQDLQQRLEDKSRQVGTMHIYIQRGGRRPSDSSASLTKARSWQSLEDASPRFREKILEYDKKRRDEEKLKPKPKPRPIVVPSPPKPERKKYVPTIIPKLKPVKPPVMPTHSEKTPVIEEEFLPPPPKPTTLRRLPSPKKIVEVKSDSEDEIIIEPVRSKPKPKPLSPIPTRMIERSEPRLTQTATVQRVHTPPRSPSPETTISLSGIPTTASLFKPTEPKPPISRASSDEWADMFETKKKEETVKDDLLSKLLSDEPAESKPTTTVKPSPPSSKRPSMITFEPSSVITNGGQRKPPTRTPMTTVYDYDQAVINLHEGKPVTTQPTSTKPSIDPFDALFVNNSTKPTNRLNNRDDTFTTTRDRSDPFESIFNNSASATNMSTTVKPTVRTIVNQNEKSQRPRLLNNTPPSVPNRTYAEEIEEFVL